jgi:hypothetical protein
LIFFLLHISSPGAQRNSPQLRQVGSTIIAVFSLFHPKQATFYGVSIAIFRGYAQSGDGGRMT